VNYLTLMTVTPKRRSSKAKGVFIGIGIIVVFVGVASIAYNYSKVQQAQQENTAAQADLTAKCQDLKVAIHNMQSINPNEPRESQYNAGCISRSGPL
jgi:uncharacterized protein YpmB